MEFKWQGKERTRETGKMKIFDHFKYIPFCKDEQWWTPSNWCISNSLLRWISQKLSFRLKFWFFDLLNNRSVKNWRSECLIANVALLETSWVWVRCFSWSNHGEAGTCLSVRKRAWKDGVAAPTGPGYRSAACIPQPCGKADLPRSRDDVCSSGSLLPSEWCPWAPPPGLSVFILSPQSWRQEWTQAPPL